MQYGVSVVYFHTLKDEKTFFPASQTLGVNFQPNTPMGLEALTDVLKELHPDQDHIVIANLIPLANDRPKPTYLDSDLEQ